jgi:tetratricopeptide (TPR) repeat protein
MIYSTSVPYVQQHIQSGLQLLQQGRLDEAWQALSAAIAADSDNALAHHLRGLVQVHAGEWPGALADLMRAVELDPADAVAHSNLSGALRAVGDYEAALASGETAVRLNPDFPDAHLNRGNALLELARPDEALASYAEVLARQPGDARAYSNRGNALRSLGRLPEAAASFEQAMALDPATPEIRANCGFAYLGMGDLPKGFGLFEARWDNRNMRAYLESRAFPAPFWRGSEPLGDESLRGKTILLHSEQGFGDVLQFCRYAPLAAERGARVLVEVDPALKPLMRSLEGVDQVFAQGETLPAFDLHCPMMSLPFAFRTTLETIPAETPYLAADPDRVDAWRRRLGPAPRPRVGLAWSSGVRPDQPELKAINGRRNLPLEKLAAFKGLDIDFVSLQKGQPAEAEFDALDQAAWAGPPILNVARELTDFGETAALMTVLDLVVSVDTSIPHLAGALGRPVWVMNRFDPCWRWLQGRSDSPWYPTARLFRQPALGDWDRVLTEVRQALAAL